MPDPAQLLAHSIAERRAGRLLPARAAAEAMTRAAPLDPRGWHMLGLVLRDLGHPADAARALDRGLALAPAHPVLLHLRALVEGDRGLPVLAFFDRALAAAPADPGVAIGRAAAILATGDAAAARAAFEAVVAAHPANVAAQSSLASFRHQQGERDDFTRGFAAALARFPADAPLWLAYLAALSRSLLPERVLATIPHARAAVSSVPGTELFEAMAMSETGNINAADALFATPGNDGPGWRAARLRHALRARRLDAAAAEAERALAQGPQAALWPYIATVWRLTGDPRHAWLEGDPRLVGVHDLAELAPGLADLATLLRRLHTSVAAPPDQSLRGGTQTDGHLLFREDPPIVALRAAIERALARHIAQLPPPDPSHPLLRHLPCAATRFIGSWSVRLTGAGHHINHMHSRGWLSSAFYVAVPGAPAPAGWLKLGQPPADLGLDLPPASLIEPRPGRLVLFPATLWHGTEPFPAGERLSVAFDAVPLT